MSYINVSVHVYSPDIPIGSAECTIYTPWYWNTVFYSLISSGENSAFAHFAAVITNHYNLLSRSTRYPSLLGGGGGGVI